MIPISVYVNRRKKLIEALARDGICSGAILLIAGLEGEKSRFAQESFFWYLTGINEPGVALLIDLDLQETVLFVPDFEIKRSLWAEDCIGSIINDLSRWGIDRLENAGSKHPGYYVSSFFSANHYAVLIECLQKILQKNKNIYTIKPSYKNILLHHQLVLFGLQENLVGLQDALKDITSYLVQMRRIKDKFEIEAIFKAVDITIQAQQAAALTIATNSTEAEVQASAEYIITGSGADLAFPSIVASGFYGTILHYTANSNRLVDNSCVIVDIGAQKNHYCADLARVYPVAGSFSARQKELYQIVLDVHLLIVDHAQPGYWLNNKLCPEKSLQHIAKAYFKKYGYEDYFIHGIGHMLGLDVHDCDDAQIPLGVDTVFTIEPGLYFAHDAIGIRLEDNYWLTKKGPICLSDHLSKEIIDLERSMQPD